MKKKGFAQLLRVFLVMRDKRWRTLDEIAMATGDPTQSVSARLRDFRKPKFGRHYVPKRHVDARTWEYQFIARKKGRLPK